MEAIAKELRETVKKYIYEISTETYSPFCQLVITNHGKRPLRIDRDLAILLDSGRELKKRNNSHQTNKKVNLTLYSL